MAVPLSGHRGGRHRARADLSPGTGPARPLAGRLLVTGTLGLLVAGLLVARSGDRPPAVGAPPAGRPAPIGLPTPAARPPAATGRPAPTAGRLPDPAAILDALDQRRALAYARRQPALLEQVYRSPVLLARDVAQLARWVPAGCQLTGLRTSYRQLRPTLVSADRLQLQVTASLAAATVSCQGAVRGRTPRVGPVRLAVALTDAGDGFRIEDEALAGPVSP